MTDNPEEGGRLRRSPVLFSLLMALGLWGVVVVLNWLGPASIPITPEQFERLQAEGLITRIEIDEQGLHCQLKEAVRVHSDGQEFVAEQVVLFQQTETDELAQERWQAAGIQVQRRQPEEGVPRSWGGWVLVSGLLAVGIWHLWAQIRQDRHGGGSPRRRLQTLEEDLKAGRISKEDFDRRSADLWAEM